jgi:hypothetical protein
MRRLVAIAAIAIVGVTACGGDGTGSKLSSGDQGVDDVMASVAGSEAQFHAKKDTYTSDLDALAMGGESPLEWADLHLEIPTATARTYCAQVTTDSGDQFHFQLGQSVPREGTCP